MCVFVVLGAVLTHSGQLESCDRNCGRPIDRQWKWGGCPQSLYLREWLNHYLRDDSNLNVMFPDACGCVSVLLTYRLVLLSIYTLL